MLVADWFVPCRISTGSPSGSPRVVYASRSSGNTSPVWKRKSRTVHSPSTGATCDDLAIVMTVLQQRATAIHHIHMPGGPVRVARRQMQHHLGHFFGLADAAQREAFAARLQVRSGVGHH